MKNDNVTNIAVMIVVIGGDDARTINDDASTSESWDPHLLLP
jgi:hypothetical protein